MWLRRAFSSYRAAVQEAITRPEVYWGERAKAIAWQKPFSAVLDKSRAPEYRWFPDGQLNMCFNCLDRHCLTDLKDEWALIYDSPVTGRILHYTYSDLLSEVQLLAGVLTTRHSVQMSDRVLIYSPNMPESVATMLACARIGAVHSVVFGGFSVKELAARIAEFQPKLIVTTDWGIEGGKLQPYNLVVDSALQDVRAKGYTEKVNTLVVFRRGPGPSTLHPGVFDYYEELSNAKKHTEAVPVLSTHPLYVLYSSGTTGKPKGIVRDTGGQAVSLDTAFDQVYGVNRKDVVWGASELGWVVGHTHGVYGPLLRGATSVLYEGSGEPDGWWKIISEHQVKCMLTDPTSIRKMKRADPKGQLVKSYTLTTMKHFTLAGERCDHDSMQWLFENLPTDCQITDHYWQTESGWPMVSNFMGLETHETRIGSVGVPVPGWDVKILLEDGREAAPGELGRVCVALPTPPGFMLGLWRNESGLQEKYMQWAPGFYMTVNSIQGDAGTKDNEGYIQIMSRLDDIIISAGKKLGSGMLENVVSSHPSVFECAVIGVRDEIKGEVPVALIILKDNKVPAAQVEKEVIARVRMEIGRIAELAHCITVAELPKTKSGKTLRGVLKAIAEKRTYMTPPGIENVEVLDDIREKFEQRGLGIEVKLVFKDERQDKKTEE